MAESENGTGKLIGAFVAGGLIGAALAILLAPEAGEETRVKLGEWLDTLTEKTEEAPAADENNRTANREHRSKLAADIRHRKEYLFKNAA